MNKKTPTSQTAAAPSQAIQLGVAWLWAGLPLAWGVTQTAIKALALFN